MKTEEKNKKNREQHHHVRKIPIWVKILISILVVVLVAGGGSWFYLQSKLNLIQRKTQVEKIDPGKETFETTENVNPDVQILKPEEVQWGAKPDIMKDKDVVNLLLIGQDRREGESRQRSDSMIICTINKKDKTLKLTSLMRDMYVQIPGYSDNRINAAYQFGGMPLLDQVIEENFGVLVDGNVEVDFEGFIKAIDVIGTIDIELNQAEADYLNKGNAKWNLVAGMNQLDGEQALSYARTRYVGHSDWERTDRQRRVIMATFDKVKGANIAEFMKLADQILPMITTDMTNAEILGYVWTVGTMGINGMESYRLPVEGTYQEATLRKGMEVLVPNLEENRAYLKKYIYE